MRKRASAKSSTRVALGLAIVAVVGAFPSAAHAHAIVEETEPGIDVVVPESPTRVVMRFNEPVEIAFGAIRVFDTNGDRVDAGDADHLEGDPAAVEVPLEPDLDKGTYTVTWRVVSADGHPISEAFVFHVKEPGENPEGIAAEILRGEARGGQATGAIFGVARWINFVGLLLLAGAVFFMVAVWRPRAESDTASEIAEAFHKRWRRIAVGSWIAVVLATLASFVLQGAVAADIPLSEALGSDVLADVADTKFGRVALIKLAVLIGMGAAWLVARRRVTQPVVARSVGAAGVAAGRGSGVGWWATCLALVFLLATPGLASHAGITDPVWLNVIADTSHVAAAALWVGGLVLLLTAMFPAIRGKPPRDALATAAPIVARFSDLAVIAIAVIVASGVYRSWEEVGAWRALTGATYGQVLLTKVAVFVPLLVLGAINNRWTKPRIEKAIAQPDPSTKPLTTLKRLVSAEIALVLVVLGVTAFLVNLAPARVEAGVTGPFTADVHFGENNLNIIVDPNEVGENFVHLTATSPEGSPVEIKQMTVLFRMPSESIGPIVGEGKKLAPGHFVVQGRQLSVPGEWELEIVGRVDRFSELRTKVSVTVNS